MLQRLIGLTVIGFMALAVQGACLSGARAQQPTTIALPAPTETCSARKLEPIAIPGATPGRIALLVTNQDYPKEVGPLAATHKDGEILCTALVALGFSVHHVKDLDAAALDHEIRAHGSRLLEAGKDAVGFFYFAGHGAAPDTYGDNYLIPARTAIEHASELVVKGYKLGGIIDQLAALAKQKGAKANFVVIDACRNIYIKRTTRGALGFNRVDEQSGLFVAFSTGPGSTAIDANHFSSALARELQVANRPAYLAFREVRRSVLLATTNRQFPWFHDGLLDSFFFKGDGSKPAYETQKGPQPLVRDGVPVLRDCGACPEMRVITMPPAPPGVIAARAASPAGAAFAIGFDEVTFDDWQMCVEAGGCNGLNPDHAGWGRGQRPVINVSWQDAQLYLKWLREISGKPYRLPTESEWQFAAQAGLDPLKDLIAKTPTKLCEYVNGGDFNRYDPLPCSDGTLRGTALVNSKLPNALGLRHMLGNVWEWMDGCWAKERAGPAEAAGCLRVVRGGSWKSGLATLTPTSRRPVAADHRSYTVGFRVARSIP